MSMACHKKANFPSFSFFLSYHLKFLSKMLNKILLSFTQKLAFISIYFFRNKDICYRHFPIIIHPNFLNACEKSGKNAFDIEKFSLPSHSSRRQWWRKRLFIYSVRKCRLSFEGNYNLASFSLEQNISVVRVSYKIMSFLA